MALQVNFTEDSHKRKNYTTLFRPVNGGSNGCATVLATIGIKYPHFYVTVWRTTRNGKDSLAKRHKIALAKASVIFSQVLL